MWFQVESYFPMCAMYILINRGKQGATMSHKKKVSILCSHSTTTGTPSLSVNSGSHTGSCPGGSADYQCISEQGSSKDHWLMGKTITPALRKCLVQELGINATYTNCSAPGLWFALGRYQECVAAIAKE